MSDVVEVRDAERELLASVISGFTKANALDDALAILEPADMWLPEHERIWDAIGRVRRTGGQPDLTSVSLALDASDRTHVIGLVGVSAGAGDPSYHAKVITNAAGMRRLAGAAASIASMPSASADLEETRERARSVLDAACEGREVSKARTIGQLLDPTLDALQSGGSPVLSTPWPDLDRHIGGLAPGRLVVFAARPGGGKSLAGTNLALHFAERHQHAAMVASLEMPEAEVMNRLISAHARVDLSSLEERRLTDAEWEAIRAASDSIRAMPLYIDDTANLTVQGIRRMARDVQRDRDDLALVVVDYLQLVTPEAGGRRNANRAEEVTGISRALKLLARETGACVVAMAQVNREGGKNDGGPRLTDLRDGGIENDADQVVLLHRPDLDVPEIEVTVAKNRHGPIGQSTLRLQGHYARLTSATNAWSPTRGIA